MQNPAPATTPEPAVTTAKKKPSKGLIIGLVVGGVAVLAAIIVTICLLLAGGKIDYKATYDELEPLKTSVDTLYLGNCYDAVSDIDSSYISASKYEEYIDGCQAEFAAVDTAINKFGQTSGAKRDEKIKKAFTELESTFKSVYPNKTTLENDLAIFTAFHKFYITLAKVETSNDTKELQEAIATASAFLEETKNAKLVEFAKGFRERGLAYIAAVEEFQKDPSYSSSAYSDLIDKAEEFTDYAQNNTLEIEDIISIDFDKIDDLYDLAYKLDDVAYDAYINSL